MQVLEKGATSLRFEDNEDSIFPIKLCISCFICDAPARSFVKKTKGHSGYWGCDKCCQKGEWAEKVIFPEINATLRSDEAFDLIEDENHQFHGLSPLTSLSVGMVTQFPLDYMHLVCLGVTRRILLLWLKSPVSKGLRIGNQAVQQISNRLLLFKEYIPREFSRKCRSLHDIERWKATEFRQFLLYSGIVALKGNIDKVHYSHYLLFFVGIYCLTSPTLCYSHVDYAHELLCMFVEEAKELYGKEFLVYNVHGLTHLAADVKNFGPLDSFSAFPFENFLGMLKKLVRKPQTPLEQVVKRLSERAVSDKGLFSSQDFVTDKPYPFPKKKHCLGPLPNGKHSHYGFVF
ncbi:uncharacterized protein LOC131948870 [Physella acuta]|uniref:uncharacterized protein LOC131948870 n=1 Tax=Physella acuta TaxID=109671 RepID=UPI0027DE0018|nr:uncharacterized protein LOC131948870 [Physella acuta]